MISDLTQPHRSLEWRWFYKSLNSKGAVFRLLNVLCDQKKKYPCSIRHNRYELFSTGKGFYPKGIQGKSIRKK